MSWHDDCFFLPTTGLVLYWSAILMASLNTSFTPTCVRWLHYMYLHLNYSSIILRAASLLMGASTESLFCNASISLQSVLFPTNSLGMSLTMLYSSGYHYISCLVTLYRALLNEDGLTTEKTIKNTSQFTYCNGLSRSYSRCEALSLN